MTDRDRHATSFASVFSEHRRELPDIDPPTIPPMDEEKLKQLPLSDLQKGFLTAASYFTSDKKTLKSELEHVESINTVGEAMALMDKISIRSLICRCSFCAWFGPLRFICEWISWVIKKIVGLFGK